MQRILHRRPGVFVVLLVAIAVTVAATAVTFASLAQGEPSAPLSGSEVAPRATGSGSPSPRNVEPPLPALVGSIGDSIGVAFDVLPDALGPNPSHEWTLGTAPGDGVYSLLERFRALGADPRTADEAKAGARMSDAARQAALIVTAAQSLARPGPAFVTIELGGNDACGGTAPAVFDRQLLAALDVLRNGTTVSGKHVPGLPPGSRLLVLSVPDIGHLRELTKDVAAAQDVYRLVGLCSRFLGARATADTIAEGEANIRAYNASLRGACDEIEASDGKGTLYCRSDQAGGGTHSMFATPFTLADISTLDYFHPSLSGQAKIADGAWAAGYWAGVPLPAAPTGTGGPAPSVSPSVPVTFSGDGGRGG